eukprot:TRINITY_DN52713_c0_g1_i1.p1 TRINITY_DN52713_c0_g1~~TRINITY_DN52713_c0_g1_i1.p1  ORF type:complete len:284 (-),score=58.97 TRINITY_DN52713_c0_g1_i1:112-918(-)
MVLQARFAAGEVVLAKYGQTERFYWAKVMRVFKSGGQDLCDLGWLRPQAGSPGGPLYVCSDGHDETLHGERLGLERLRRPNAAELGVAAPCGAAACAAANVVEVSDLIGEAMVEEVEAAQAPQSLDAMLAALVAKNSAASPGPGAPQTQTSRWEALQGSACAGLGGYCMPPPQPMKPPSFTAQVSVAAPPLPAEARIAASEAQARVSLASKAASGQCAFDLGLASEPCGVKQAPLTPAGPLTALSGHGKQERFDFVSDMLSGALAAKA